MESNWEFDVEWNGYGGPYTFVSGTQAIVNAYIKRLARFDPPLAPPFSDWMWFAQIGPYPEFSLCNIIRPWTDPRRKEIFDWFRVDGPFPDGYLYLLNRDHLIPG